MQELTDVQLIQIIRAGNSDAFGILFERYLSMAQNIAQNMVRDRAAAEDLAQEAMLQAYLSLDGLADPNCYASWLHGIVRNVCNSYLRHRTREPLTQSDLAPENLGDSAIYIRGQREDDPARIIEQTTRQEEIRKAILRLACKQRESAWLFYLEQMSIREIALNLEASETAIKSRLFQARKHLQTHLALLHPEITESVDSRGHNQERKPIMIKIDSVHTFTRADNQAILLFVAEDIHSETRRCLQMWIGSDLGYALEQILKGEETRRPLTHNTMAQMVELLDAKVTHVEVSAIKETTFYGTIFLESNGTAKQLDSRPSDAVTLALASGAPIYIAKDVMEKNGSDLPDPFDETEWLAKVKLRHQERVELLEKWQDALSAEGSTFTFRARNACTIMMAEADQYGHNYLGTEHLLLGLVAEKEGVAGKVLNDLGVTYDLLEKLMVGKVGTSDHKSTALPVLAPRLTKVFELSEAERTALGHTFIGTEHLLLGILGEADSDDSDQEGMALRFLHELNVGLDEIREKVTAVFGEDS